MSPILTYLMNVSPEKLDSVRDFSRQEGKDFYTKVASLALGIEVSDVTTTQRDEAKAALFAYTYRERPT